MSKFSLVSATITLGLLAATAALGQGQAPTQSQPTPDEVRLSEQVNRLARQVRASQAVATKQAAVAQRALATAAEQASIANQNAQALKDAVKVVNTEAETLNQQDDALSNQAKSLQIARMGLYVAAGVIVLVVGLVVFIGFRLWKRVPAPASHNSDHNRSQAMLHLAQRPVMPTPAPAAVVPEPVVSAPASPSPQPTTARTTPMPKISPDTLVHPNSRSLSDTMKDKGVDRLPYVFRLNDGSTFNCLAIKKSELGPPVTRFTDFPEIPEVKWEERIDVALGLLRGEAKVS